MSKIFFNCVIGNPSSHPWHVFCRSEDEWEETKENILFTEERYLPEVLVQCGVAKSASEVEKKKPEFCRTLNESDFIVVKWGKRYVAIQIGERI